MNNMFNQLQNFSKDISILYVEDNIDLSKMTTIILKQFFTKIVLLGTVGTADEISKSIQHAKEVEGVLSVKSFLKYQKKY